ncbi:1-phosphofructokinase [Brochothrix campestris]|uniref:Tagatose-6-phosphate kinase n=1 Tax=Brochothrix campestris FSL F6-1037 TaxID=1265861 RepID=W7CT74_9LIST|nr:1-phosphofructokinase [Brochothrix campestris]EUJ39880.1 1-phosphofructokinase [Brochothrix campestris FSL F6-1037]
MIYTVTLNPAIDYIVEVNDLTVGEVNRMHNDLKLPGGKGINVSRILNELTVANQALGFLGGFTGEFIKNCLNDFKIPNNFIQIAADTRINVKLKATAETEINAQGPAITPAEAKQLLAQFDELQAADIVILSGSIPPALGRDFYDKIIAKVKQAGAQFVIDTTGDPLERALAQKPLLVKPNHHELADLFHVSLETKDDIITYGQKLRRLGAQNVLVSMAGAGAILITAEGVFESNVPTGTVKNSVGAGDSMIGGFIGAFVQTGDLLTAFQTGVATGSATAFSYDIATAAEIANLVPTVNVTKK